MSRRVERGTCSEAQPAGALLLFILGCLGASASNLFQSEEKPVTHKLLEVKDKLVGLCGGRGSFISKCDPEVVLYHRSSSCKL